MLALLRNCHTSTLHSQCRAFSSIKPGKVLIPIGGSEMTVEFGRLARMADGSAVVSVGDTSVMVTAVSRTRPSATNYLPLTVDYRQKAAAAGRIPTNFLRREIGSSTDEILTGRVIDRSLRPLFPPGFFFETQIVCNLLAVDAVHDPDVASINGASVALALSDIPWHGPVAAVRVGYVDGEVVMNPTRRQQEDSRLDMIVTSCADERVVMLEAAADQLPYDTFSECVAAGVREGQRIVETIDSIRGEFGRPKRDAELSLPDAAMVEFCHRAAVRRLEEIFTDSTHDKMSRDEAVTSLRSEAMEALRAEYPAADTFTVSEVFNAVTRNVFRGIVLKNRRRCDGRYVTSLRDVSCDVSLYKPLHGSALFQRGQTQCLCTVTFDSLDSAFRHDPVSWIIRGIREKNFMLHYEFPPYATRETGRPGAVGRRELGHGMLAEKALRPVVPPKYPFTIRLTSEVLESNGSSSMASVCGGTLALQDAGVPLTAQVAGVAVGLVADWSPDGHVTDYCLLTDIMGIEDYMGDLDLKIAGSSQGVTALQADIKAGGGLPLGVVSEAVSRGQQGITELLTIMRRTLTTHRLTQSDKHPVTEQLTVPLARRHRFVGHGGYNLRKLTQDTGVQVTQVDDCTYSLFAPNRAALEEAKSRVEQSLTAEHEPELEFGKIYKARIVELREFGVMVTLFPTMTPILLHNSQLDQRKVSHPSALGLDTGQDVLVKYFGRDPVSGQVRLSRKVLSPLSGAAVTGEGEDRKDEQRANPWAS